MRQFRPLVAAATLSALLSGCGVGSFLPQLGQPPEQRLRARDSRVIAVVDGVRQAWEKTKTVSGEVSFWEQKGFESSSSKAEFYWSRPQKLRANIVEADSVTRRGAKLVYLGDGRITAKLGFIKRSFAFDDPQVLSLRGYRIDQTSLTAIVEGLLDPEANVRYVGPVTLGGRASELVWFTGGKGMLPGLSRMQVAIDRQNRMPVLVEGFESKDVVFRAHLSGLTLNPALSDDLFRL